ncbi:hypothetical protein HK405_010196, partial [Cladochytrium tenue]
SVTEDDKVDTGSSDTSPTCSNVSVQAGAAAAQRHVLKLLKYANSGLVQLNNSIDSHLHFNPAVSLIVCASCGVGLPDGSKSGRLQHVHSVSRSGPAAQAAIRVGVDACRVTTGIVDDAQAQDVPAPAIEGLVLHHNGLQCALCKYCTPLRKSQLKHTKLMHHEANTPHMQPRSIAIQSLFGVPSIQYVHVAIAEDRLLAPAMNVQDPGVTAGQFVLTLLECTLTGDGELT